MIWDLNPQPRIYRSAATLRCAALAFTIAERYLLRGCGFKSKPQICFNSSKPCTRCLTVLNEISGILWSLYPMEYFARKNCPPAADDSFFVPKSWSCPRLVLKPNWTFHNPLIYWRHQPAFASLTRLHLLSTVRFSYKVDRRLPKQPTGTVLNKMI